ncbi:MAG: chorismate mutase [Clostridia bacterium]|nr:chorismate mutase [Clostridia bacterium]
MSRLEEARREIDVIDQQMAELFCKRMEAVKTVAMHKKEHGLPIHDPMREAQVIARNSENVDDDTLKEYYTSFLQDLMGTSRAYQTRLLEGMRVAFSGTLGAFAHIAVKKLFPTATAVPYGDFTAAYHAVENGECDAVVLPIENSFNGEVGQVTDLMFAGNLYVNRIIELAVDQDLLVCSDAVAEDIKEVVSHPQALGQCADYIRAKGYTSREYGNTALAAKYVAEKGDKSLAAIASAEAAELFGLKVLERNINTDRGNTTRFAVMTRAENRVRSNSGTLCSILLFTVKHQAGALAKALDIIGLHGFNMGVLRSRPTKGKMWQYYFYAEVEGDVRTPAGEDMLRMLGRFCDCLKHAGTYEKGE